VRAESTLNFVVRTLHQVVKKGKEDAWPYQGSQDVSRSSVDSFIKLHDLPAQYTATDNGATTTAELWDLSPFTNFDAYDDTHFGTVWCNASNNLCAVVAPAVLTLTEYNKTKKATARTKVTLCFNVVRWDGEEFALDGSFKGRKKKNKAGLRVWASTKAHRLTKQLIWRREEDAECTEIEKIRETLWRLRVRVVSLANLAGIKAPVGVEAAAIGAYLDKLEAGVQEMKETVENVVGVVGSCGDEKTELCKTLNTSIHFCVNEAKLCRERLNKRVRIEETFGFTFHPGTQCSCCSVQPIVGWRYHCNECDIDLCSNQKCIFSHDLGHPLVLIRSPPPQPITAVVTAAEEQRWVVNSIMDRWPLKKKKGEKGPRKYLYHVQWQGKGMAPTWETAEALGNPSLTAQYDEQCDKKGKKRLLDKSRY
jgi:hypothetical protein